MNFFEMIIAFVIVFLCVYTLINRICKCIECKELSKAFSAYIQGTSNKLDGKSMEEVAETANEFMKRVENGTSGEKTKGA